MKTTTMSSNYRHSLSLRARHDTADLSIILQTLEMPAARIWKAGEPRLTPKGTPLEGIYDASYCSIKLPLKDDLPASLMLAVDALAKHWTFLEELREGGVKLAFSIGWFSEGQSSGDTLDLDLLQKIADQKISLELNFYAPDGAQV
jgi:hypothetical protein